MTLDNDERETHKASRKDIYKSSVNEISRYLLYLGVSVMVLALLLDTFTDGDYGVIHQVGRIAGLIGLLGMGTMFVLNKATHPNGK